MALKVVFFYNQASRGWTETFYSTSSTTPIQFVNGNFTPKFYSDLVAFRNQLTYLYAVRVSNVGSPRLSWTSVLGSNYPGQGQTITFNPGPEVASTDLVIKMNSETGQSKTVSLRRTLGD